MASVFVRGVTKNFNSVIAVNRLSLNIQNGELVSLLGPSGCGKTTMLRLLAGFLIPDEGEIIVGEKTISSSLSTIPPEKRNMSMIFQSYAVWPHMTVFENVAYGLRLRNVKIEEQRAKVTKILSLVRLGGLDNRYPGEVSGGQQQRIALARAIVVEPEILLLDEPLSNLDANLREEMRFEIRRLHKEFGITAIYVTHDQAEAMVISDRIAVMNHGRLEQIGTPEDIYERPTTPFVAEFVGQTNLFPGVLKEGDVFESDGFVRIRTMGMGGLKVGELVTLCIRPHKIGIHASHLEVDERTNVFNGIVQRESYLGNSRDYVVDIGPGKMSARVSADTAERFEIGQNVYISIDPKFCRILRSL